MQRIKTPDLDGRRVFCVEDNAANREVLRDYLERIGVVAVIYEFPDQVQEHLAVDKQFDPLIFDMLMPEMDGPQLLDKLGKDHQQPPHNVDDTHWHWGRRRACFRSGDSQTCQVIRAQGRHSKHVARYVLEGFERPRQQGLLTQKHSQVLTFFLPKTI